MDAVLDDIPSSRLAALVELRKHYKVYLLSNLYDTAWDLTQQLIRKEGYSIEQCFDEAFISYKMHVAKPNPLIYLKVFEATGIQPEETMYFDDSRDNIEAARKLGILSCLVPMNEIETCKEYQKLIETCSR
jgi:putative hydrolase of the HAD superfamily